MKRVLVNILCVCLMSCSVFARTTVVGDVYPGYPFNWDDAYEVYIGRNGVGSLSINDGSSIINNRRNYIGYNSGSSGSVTVDGEGSVWGIDRVFVGYNGNGTLDITNGASVISDDGYYIGRDSGVTGKVTVDGADSILSSRTSAYVGFEGIGTLDITNGAAVSNSNGYIGYKSGSTGIVTVDGADSIWSNSIDLDIGYNGTGTLNITNGGTVQCSYNCHVGREAGSSGTLTVDNANLKLVHYSYGDLYVGSAGSGIVNIINSEVTTSKTSVGGITGSGKINFDNGTLNAESICAAADDLAGTGTINTRGILSDVDLVFDSPSALIQTFTINKNAGQNITVNLDVHGSKFMGAGYSQAGSLSVSNGVEICSTYGYFGYKPGSVGIATVDGKGSSWSGDTLWIGLSGDGTLNITNGATVVNRDAYIGRNSGSTGTVIVDGEGSSWRSHYLWIGLYGDGTLNITNGGTVRCSGYSSIGHRSGQTGTVIVDGEGSLWNNNGHLDVGDSDSGSGSLKISNGGLVTVGGSLTINDNEDGDSSINISTGGMLALNDSAAGSLQIFLDLIEGTDAINFFNEDTLSWEDITSATMDVDYTLEYIDDISEDLYGYTILTVGTVPEPATIMLLAIGGLALAKPK